KDGELILRSNKTFLKSISGLLVIFFLFQDLVYAAPDLKPIEWKVTPNYKPWARHFLPEIPDSVAVVEDAYHAPRTQKTLILVQDAHTNASAQLHTAQALESILAKYPGVRHIFTEAADRDASLSFLRAHGTPAQRKQIAEKYLRRGLLHGVEYLD